ncbi:MAG: GGDEF domain-containing protein [Lachnospiraceae bacterium]|nr:GGDEF domain-containing protein [Lachnospiraceae bacterium]
MRSRNSFVNVYINDQLIYEDNTNISRMFGSSPGSRWHQIPIGLNDDPVRLCLEVTACFYNSHGMVDSIYIGKENDVYNKVVSSRLFGFIISSFFYLMGLVLIYAHFHLSHSNNLGKDLLYLGIATFFCAQWSNAETLLWQLFIGHSEVIHMIEYVSLPAIPLSLGVLACYRLRGKMQMLSYFYTWICSINMFAVCFLHVTYLAEFHYTLTFTHVLLGVMIPFMVMLTLSYINPNDKKQSLLLIAIILIVLIFCVISALARYITGIYSSYSTHVRIALICFLSCLIFYQLNQVANTFSKGLKSDMIHDMAIHDYLTGLYNRTGYGEHEKLYNNMIRNNTPIGIIQLDVNNLKLINDNLGHEIGDKMINAVAQGLKLAFPETQAKCYRMGGDEFLVMLDGKDPEQTYRNGFNCLRDYCNEQNHNPDNEFRLQIAHGYVLIEHGSMTLEDAMEKADMLMYINKKALKTKRNLR